MNLGERISLFSISNIRGALNVEPLSDERTPLADFPNSLLGSVPGCGRRADAGLRPHLLGQKAATVFCRLAASVKD